MEINEKPKNRNLYFLPIIILIITLGSIVRFYSARTHFTHIDDLHPISFMLFSEQHFQEKDANELINTGSLKLDSPQRKGINFLYKIHVLKPLLKIAYPYYRSIKVSENMTYAPFQFLFTSFFINKTNTYEEIKFGARIPSLVFGILAIISFSVLLFYLNDKQFNSIHLVSIALMACSWESIIYCSQANPYIIGVFFFLLTLILSYWLLTTTYSWKKYFITGLIISLGFYAQYQLFFIIPTILLAFCVLKYRQLNHSFSKTFKQTIFFASPILFFLIQVFFSYLIRNANAGVGWNQGPNSQFLFHFDEPSSIVKNIIYPFYFFSVNTYKVITATLGFMDLQTFVMKAFGVLLFILVLLGFYNITLGALKKKEEKRLFFFISFSSLIFIWFILIIVQKISLSPTRHQLILIPLFLITIYYGLVQIKEFFKVEKLFTFFTYSFAASIITLFCLNISENFADRKDPIKPEQLEALLKNHKVDQLIGYHFTENYLYLLPNTPSINRENGEMIFIGESKLHDHLKESQDVVALISTRKPLSEAHIPSIFEVGNNHIKLNKETYHIVEKQEIFSKTEVEFSQETLNGRNELFFYILKKM